MAKLADEEENNTATNVTNTFQTSQITQPSAPVEINNRETMRSTEEINKFAQSVAASPVKPSSRPASLPLDISSPKQDESSLHTARLKAVPIPVVPPPVPQPPSLPSASPLPSEPKPETQPSLEPARRKPPVPQPYKESIHHKQVQHPSEHLPEPAAVRRKPPVPEPHVIPTSEVSPAHDFDQVMADLSGTDLRPLSAHIYENADTWLTTLISNSRTRPQPEAAMARSSIESAPLEDHYTLPQRKPSKANKLFTSVTSQVLDLSAMDPTSDYVPMTPCNRSHSLKQI